MSIIKMVRRDTPDAANVGGLDLYPDNTSGEYTQIDENGDTLSLAVQRNKGLLWHRHASDGALECWYPANLAVSGDAIATITVSGNSFNCFPFPTGRGGRLDRMAVRVWTGATAGGKCRIGIYSKTSDTNIYPGALFADFGELATDTPGVIAATISQVLPADDLVWLCCWYGSYATNPVMRRMAARGIGGLILGTQVGLDNETSQWLYKTHTYAGSFPDPAPSGLAHTIFNSPGLYVRYDA